eukprot:9748113-Lingulodinium_polyedra.AAC.1
MPENDNGAQLRIFMESTGLCAYNTYYDTSPTYYGQHHVSWIDYIVGPPALLGRLRTCATW